MFVPIKPEIAKMVKSKGVIKFFVFGGWEFIAVRKTFAITPHKIMYVERYKPNSNRYYRVFDCRLTLNRHSLIVEEIAMAQKEGFELPGLIPAHKPLPKASEDLFLKMTVKAAENMAELCKKERIVITSNLSTFTETASELGFSIKKTKFSERFKAMKTLQNNEKVNQT